MSVRREEARKNHLSWVFLFLTKHRVTPLLQLCRNLQIFILAVWTWNPVDLRSYTAIMNGEVPNGTRTGTCIAAPESLLSHLLLLLSFFCLIAAPSPAL